MILSISNSAINRMNILDSFGTLFGSKNGGIQKTERNFATPLPRLKSMLQRQVVSSSRITKKGEKYFHASLMSSNKKEEQKSDGIKAKRSQTIADLKNSRMEKKNQQSKHREKGQLSLLSPDKGSILAELFKKSVYETPNNKNISAQTEQKNLKASSNLNYNQYEQIVTRQEIPPTHFEKIANRNDQKSLKSQFLLGLLQTSIKISEESRRKQASSFTNRSSERIMMRHINKQTLQKKKGEKQIQNIIGCKLGVLSNLSIKETIEDQMMRQQRQRMQKGANLPTDESDDGASEAEAKNQTKHRPLNLKQVLKKRKKLMRIAQKKLRTQPTIPQQFKERFEQIMHKHDDFQKSHEKDPQQIYQDRQQQMLYCESIYHPKKFIMKHKVQWKV